MGKGKKRKLETREKDNDANEFNLPAKFLASSHIRSNEKRLIIILDGAQLETVKVSRPSWLTPCATLITYLLHLIGWQCL